MRSVSRIISILFVCSLWTVEARSFKKQENALALVALSNDFDRAPFFCGQWSSAKTTCSGDNVQSVTGKSASECRDWCMTQGIGCCETQSTGTCRFVDGSVDTLWSPEDSQSTLCTGDVYTQMSRFGECGWDGADAANQHEILPEVVTPTRTVDECKALCTANSTCNFISYGGMGACHLFGTCDGDNFGFWMVVERVGGETQDLCASVSCGASDSCHVEGTCDSLSGVCSYPSVDDGTACDDNDNSTTSDQCVSGVCAGTGPGVTGDPHFVGFDGSRYDFQGSPGSVFNIISDESFQLNARFVESPTDGKTYMGAVGIKVGSNQVVITPDVVVVNDRSVANGDHVYLYDGEEALGMLVFDELRIHVKSLSFQLDINVAHDGGFVYLDVNAAANSDYLVHPHGILGQTAQYLVDGSKPQPVRLSHRNLYASGFLAGSPDDYLVTDGLMGTDFTFNRFGIQASSSKSPVPRRFGFGRALYQKQV